ncbi:tetracycline resistance [Cladorrhinum sp. PSN259]|nr:tetracycline resistance [Cladorrhinum sp. PSN259]
MDPRSGLPPPSNAAWRLSTVVEVPEEMDPTTTSSPRGKRKVMAVNTTVSEIPSSSPPPSPTKADRDVDLETSRQSTPDGSTPHHISPSSSPSPRNRINYIRLAAICFAQFTLGLTDSATGTLIPTIESYYFPSPPNSPSSPSTPTPTAHLQTSLLFVGQALGFILGAAFLDPIRSLFRNSKHPNSYIFTLCNTLVCLAYIPLLLTANPFVTIVLSFFLLGFGNSFNLALGNVFVAGMGTKSLGVMHGMYGLGGTLGPLIANGMVSSKSLEWGKYYWITMGLAVLGAGSMGGFFWGYEEDGTEIDPDKNEEEKKRGRSGCISVSVGVKEGRHWQAVQAAVDWRIVPLGALFIFAYKGVEVSISGWAYTFLKEDREAGTDFGYATAGFWAGITLGRFILTPFGHRFGDKRFVYILSASCVALQILVWFVKDAIADSVVLATIGLLLGPVYPCVAAVFLRNMEENERVTGIGIISAFGMSGGAVAPFITGAIADSRGSWVLNPIAIALYGAMLVCWYFLSNDKVDEEQAAAAAAAAAADQEK